ncbi:hypothetical protein LCGC14_1679350 [marine sediment metagenome]|uniref:Polydeoxyribonucleotide synthase [ATP] n=1 Tax=marine sediment metagenome TaxID=412755 RepID=A0A0F9KP46_9ZZZZ
MIDIQLIKINLFLSDAYFVKDKDGKIRFWKAIADEGGFYSITGNLEKRRVYSNLKSNFIIVNPNSIREVYEQMQFEMVARCKQKVNAGFKLLIDLKLSYGKKEDNYIDSCGNIHYDIYDYLIVTLPKYKSDNKGHLKPMLAKTFKENTCKYPMYGQPKINGIRGNVRWTEQETGTGIFKNIHEGPLFTSREGKIYHLPHLMFMFTKDMFFDKGEELVYDGELYIHGESLNIIRASCPMILDNGTISKCSGDPKRVQFWCFDLAILIQQKERFKILDRKIDHFRLKDESIENIHTLRIVKVPRKMIFNDLDAKIYAEYCIEKGFEGAILRDPDALYGFGYRGKAMIKVKKPKYTECVILDIISKPKEPSTALFVLQNDINNNEFLCNPTGTWKERADYLSFKEAYIGMKVIVKYYERSGIKKCPFHANILNIIDNNNE